VAINPDYLVGGTTEDDALVAVNDARAVIVAKMSGGSTGADDGGADAGQAEEAGLDPLLSLHDFDLKTAKKTELEALVGQHRSWTAGTNPGRKGLVWTQRAEGAAAGATAQPDGAVGAGAAAGATAAATGGAAAGAAPPAAPAAATEAAIPGAAAAGRGGTGWCLPPLHHGKLRLRCSWSMRNQRCDRLSPPSSLIIIEFRFDVPLFGIHNHTSVTPHHYAAM